MTILSPKILRLANTRLHFLECDGMSRVLSHFLHAAGEPHRLVPGHLFRTDGKHMRAWTLDLSKDDPAAVGQTLRVPANSHITHMWVEVPSGRLDLRARKWFGKDAPQGVFQPVLFPQFRYVENPAEWPHYERGSVALAKMLRDLSITSLAGLVTDQQQSQQLQDILTQHRFNALRRA